MKKQDAGVFGVSFTLGCLWVASLLAAPAPNEPWKRNAPITGAYDKALAVKCVNGIFVGKQRGNIIEHLGIPYAVQPVGKLRWTEPQLAPMLKYSRETTLTHGALMDAWHVTDDVLQ